jgi:predicted MFS family arabinose efflux permease
MTSLLALSQVTGVFGLITGPMADGWGRRRMMLAGLLMLAGGMLLAAVFPTFATVLLALFLAGLGKTFFDPPLKAYLGDWVPYERRGRAMGLLEYSWAGSLLLGIPLIALLVDRLGWRSPFFLLAVAGLVGTASILMLYPRGRARPQHPGTVAGLLHAWRYLGRDSAAVWFLVFSLLVGAANLALFVVYGAWMEESFGLSIVALGATGLLIGTAELLGEGLTAFTADRLGLKQALTIGTVLLVVSYCLLPWGGQSLSMALAGLFIVFVGYEFVVVTAMSLATELLPQARATMISALIVASSVGRAVGTAGGALVWQRGGLLATSFVAAAITALGLACLVWGLRAWRPGRTPGPQDHRKLKEESSCQRS